MMKQTIGILAHVDAGKTTLSEQILYNTNSIRKLGRVDHRDTFLDSHNIEKSRGITVFSDQASFQLNNNTYYLVDTPGHIDFSTEMERILGILDYGIIVISAVEGIQGHTETIWQILKKYNIPTFIFINKIDREGADVEALVKDIKVKFNNNIFKLGDNIDELVAESNDELLEEYLEGNLDSNRVHQEGIELIKSRRIFPYAIGSALQNKGVNEFMELLDYYTNSDYKSNDQLRGRVFKIKYDEKNTRLTFIKILTGTVKVKDEIVKGEKVNAIRIYNGNKYIQANEGEAGDIIAVTGINSLNAGDVIGDIQRNGDLEIIPTLKSKVIYDPKINIKDILGNLRILESEDPTLNIVWNEEVQEIHVSIMGKIQLEILQEIIESRFNLKVEFGPCEVLYRETIKEKTVGYGHFEPLRHYSEVHLKMEPLPYGSGIEFESKCHTDNLGYSHQNLIKTHIFERSHKGILTGSPLVDIKFTLLTGRAHNKHTSGGDFREATYRAIRQGLEEVENILLEPFYKFKIEVNKDLLGRVMSDIQRLSGEFQSPTIINESAIIEGTGPVAKFMEYPVELMSFTSGRGIITLSYVGYDLCHNSEEVILNKGYKANADIEYTSTSIFCSKGQSFLVEGSKIKDYIHCEVVE